VYFRTKCIKNATAASSLQSLALLEIVEHAYWVHFRRGKTLVYVFVCCRSPPTSTHTQ